MIFQRRALKRRLDELRAVLGAETIDNLAARLNRAGKHRIAAMWEVVVLHGLSKCGALRNESPLASLRRPDIAFQHGTLRFIADITAVSDEGLDNDNPYRELCDLIEGAKRKLGLPIGGLHLEVHSKQDQTKRGTRTVLLLPPRQKLQAFVQQTVFPQLREQIDAGETVLHLAISDNDLGLDININPANSPYSSGSFAAYDVPKIKDRNPLYNALKAKADQLRGVEGLTGIIVGDGDCVALSGRSENWAGVSAKQIVEEFFRQFSSVDFIVLLSVRETRSVWGAFSQPVLQNHESLFVRDGCSATVALDKLFRAVVKDFPRPVMMPVNGALRAREDSYDLGHHGAYTVSGSSIRLGLREFTEILAGLRTLTDNGAKFVDAGRKRPQKPSKVRDVVLRNLKEGRLPASVEIIRTDEDDNDDWVEITFGEIDPAIAPIR